MPAGTTASCAVSICANPCGFHPDIAEIPLSGLDCNGGGVPDECQRCTSDLDHDGIVGPMDLVIMFGAWGPC
ncbi:MAG: hypothetical protein U0572_18320 [Phycisphaerales bacterium]